MNTESLFDLEKYEIEPPKATAFGKARLRRPERNQVCFSIKSIDELISKDHRVRQIWAFISAFDFSSFTKKVQAVEGGVGRSATDPALLLAIWVFGIVEGIGSARTLARYCKEHHAFIWLCGNVSINHHTLSDFCNDSALEIDDLMAQVITSLIMAGIVSLDRVSQDGMRVRANASLSSFRSEEGLETLLKASKKHIRQLKKDIKKDPSKLSLKEKAAQERACRERKEKVENALVAMKALKKKNHKK